MKRTTSFAALAALTALTLSACGSSSDKADSSKDSAASGVTKIVVGASPVPHQQILEFVKNNLAKEAGLDLQIKPFQDYVLPNSTLQDGEIDANYYQHLPYLEEEKAKKGYTFDHGTGIHIEPYGIYSKKIKGLNELSDGASVAITNDPSNQARALKLLEANNLIKLANVDSPTIFNITENPKNLTFKEAEAPAVPKLLPDVDIAIINGNYALENNLKPSKDAIYLESGEDNPYSNILVWNSKAEASKIEAVKKLDELLHSREVADYITATWPDGEVIPAF